MGQDTYSSFGVSVGISTSYPSRLLLYLLIRHLNEGGLQCYLETDYDEVIDLSYQYADQVSVFEEEDEKEDHREEVQESQPTTDVEPSDDEESEYDTDDEESKSYLSVKTIRKLAKTKNQEEYNKILGNRHADYHFMIPFINGSVRNISRRDNPCIFENVFRTPSDIVKQINQAVEFFKSLNIPEKKISIGSYFYDSC